MIRARGMFNCSGAQCAPASIDTNTASSVPANTSPARAGSAIDTSDRLARDVPASGRFGGMFM